jgi:hypothetical protein
MFRLPKTFQASSAALGAVSPVARPRPTLHRPHKFSGLTDPLRSSSARDAHNGRSKSGNRHTERNPQSPDKRATEEVNRKR